MNTPARAASWSWRGDLVRAVLVLMLTNFAGGLVVQEHVWPSRGSEEQELLMESIFAVAMVAAVADFLLALAMRALRLRVPGTK